MQTSTFREPANIAGRERVFEIQELFFSTTDEEGRIKTSNAVFVRVSGYAAAELRGQPHNIIRHPDMPRVIFQLVWDEIKAGRPILAYAKNRAKDGPYYWVVALVTPIYGGYLSVRFKPSSELFGVVQNLYREVRQVELEAEAGDRGKKAAIAAGAYALDAKLRSLGFADYRAFMRHAFEREIRSRETLKTRSAGFPVMEESEERSLAGETGGDGPRRLAEACQAALLSLDRLFNDLEVYSRVNDDIRSQSEFVTSLSESIQLVSRKGILEAQLLGTAGVGAGTVLHWLQWFSGDIAEGGVDLTKSLLGLVDEIKSVIFELNSAKLQIEMTAKFALEILRAGGAPVPDMGLTPGAMEDLYVSSRTTVGRALAALAGVETNLQTVEKSQQNLRKSIRSARLIYGQGKVELAGAASEPLRVVFDDLNRRLSEAEQTLGGLEHLIREIRKELQKDIERIGPIEQAVANIDPGPRGGL